ncbi:MAG: DEAD/DEAH box helicase [Candidatus Nanopelagicales bacterium]
MVDLILDSAGLWTTDPLAPGPEQFRPVITPGTISRWPVRPFPLDAGAGARLGDLVASGRLNQRAAPLARVAALALQAARELAIPSVRDDGPCWIAAPGPRTAGALTEAIMAAAGSGMVSGSAPEETVRAFAADLVDAAVRRANGPPESLPWVGDSGLATPKGRRSLANWSGLVQARAAAGVRLAIMVEPPGDSAGDGGLGGGEDAGQWRLVPFAVALGENTTRLPAQDADPGVFGANPRQWAAWQRAEHEVVARLVGRYPEFAGLATGMSSLMVTAVDVLRFIDRLADLLVAAGIDVIAPGGLFAAAAVRRRVRAADSGTGTLSVGGLGLAADIEIDGEPLTAEECRALAASKSELVSVRGRWHRLTPADAARIAALTRRLAQPVSPADLLAEVFDGVEFTADTALPESFAPARPIVAAGVRAELRHYQQAGVDWLGWLAANGIGGVLADDMGLGKTLQVLAWISADLPSPAPADAPAAGHDQAVRAGPCPSLVVCPVTLVDTWLRQSAQFTPHLRVHAYHGSGRSPWADDVDVVITTYGLLARAPELNAVPWRRVVLDEAQAIKNPDTQAARAARALTADQRLAVTGTPVENSLADLWSLFAFAQPGLLPRRKAFLTRFKGAAPADLARLRAVVNPFLLRRVKTDPGILPELPDRTVIRDDCTFTREQVGAYEAVVADLQGALEELRAAAKARAQGEPAAPDDTRRRATVLAAISRLKQICVHPALLTESRRGLGQRSGKVSRLAELTGQIVAEGQAVVIFTQFASFVPDLAAHLTAELGIEVLTLSGSDARPARAATVAAFDRADGPPVLIASLRAGGTGLTLVRANHVIHLDRWWNPAVEDQASDRVWRIGQTQKVTVHVLVCPGTLEEKIDEALSAKRALAASVVQATETAITELDDSALAELVTLVGERVLQ